jgi:endonuclease/exonuclease/phosphatase (EEP) superfamily protein YafD
VARGLGALLLVDALAAALAGLLSHGAGLDARLDLLAHFAPVYMAVAVACMAIAILARPPARGVILTASAVGIVASGLLIAPEFSRSNDSEVPFDRADQIKVIQINALRSNVDIRRVADWLIAQNPDVVTISEARHDLRDLLIRRAGWSTAGAHGSLMIFTREPYLQMDRPTLRPGAGVSFVNATYASRSGPIEIVTTHLDWPTSPLVARQVRDLEDVVGRLPRERMILTGDFNAAPWSADWTPALAWCAATAPWPPGRRRSPGDPGPSRSCRSTTSTPVADGRRSRWSGGHGSAPTTIRWSSPWRRWSDPSPRASCPAARAAPARRPAS